MRQRIERYETEINGKKWDVTVVMRHDPIRVRDAKAMLRGMIVRQLMDDMMKQVGEG